MKSIKKLKKYGTAAAGTALLVGATLTGAAATNHGGSSGTSLGDYPAPFVDDDGTIQSSIVVGEDAATADVVGAIDIAGSLSQAAFTTESVEGGDATTVNGAQYEGDIGDTLEGTSAPSTIDASDYDALTRKTITDADDENHFVTESVTLAKSEVSTDVNATDVEANVGDNAITYKANFAPGFEQSETLEMLGQEFEVTAVTQNDDNANQVELGSTVTQDQLGLDETYEHGPYTVKVEDFNQNDNTVLVQVSQDGEQLKMKGIGSGEDSADEVSVNGGDFVVTAESIYFGSQGNYISLSSTYTDTVLTEGEDFPLDEDYTVSSISGDNFDNGYDNGTVQSVSLQNDIRTNTNYENTDTEDDRGRLVAGESISGPTDLFDLTYQGLTSESTTSVQVSDGHEVSYTDAEGFEQSVDLGLAANFTEATDDDDTGLDVTSLSDGVSGHVDVEGHPVQVEVDDADGTKVTFSYETYSKTLTEDGNTDDVDESTGYGFRLNASLYSGGTLEINNSDQTFNTQFNKSLALDTNGPVTVGLDEDEDGVADVNVSYADTTDDSAVKNVTGTANGPITEEDTDDRSVYGSTVAVGNDLENVDLTVPENQLMTQFALGAVSESSGEGAVSQTPTYGDTFPSVGHLDTDENIGQVKENDNVIVVGGPAINDLTAELAAENQTRSANEWQTGGYEGESILQLVDGWNEDTQALVVAGHAAEDTRTASEFLSNYGDHSDALEGQDQVTISTETGNVVQ